MMKRMLGHMAAFVFLVGLVGTAQAAGYGNGIDFCLDGPDYNRDYNAKQIVQTKLRPVQEASLYIDGFSEEELELMRIVKMLDETAPAAGNNSILRALMEPQANALTFLE